MSQTKLTRNNRETETTTATMGTSWLAIILRKYICQLSTILSKLVSTFSCTLGCILKQANRTSFSKVYLCNIKTILRNLYSFVGDSIRCTHVKGRTFLFYNIDLSITNVQIVLTETKTRMRVVAITRGKTCGNNKLLSCLKAYKFRKCTIMWYTFLVFRRQVSRALSSTLLSPYELRPNDRSLSWQSSAADF